MGDVVRGGGSSGWLDAIGAPVSRRAALAAGLALAATPAVGSADDEPPALRDLAAAKGLRFGNAVNPRTIVGARGRLVTAECNILVAENEFKFGTVRPDERTFSLAPADRVARFADGRGIPLRGHNLFWNQPDYVPAWLTERNLGPRPRIALEDLLVQHVRVMARRYPRVVSWDVINETVVPETGAMRDTVATRLLGDRVLDLTFAAARQAMPRAELVYNDYMNWEPGNDPHRSGVLRVLEGMRKRGVPCDALGLQSHLAVPDGPPGSAFGGRQSTWRRFLKEVNDLGYRLLVTELDVDDRKAPSETARRDEMVAETTRAYLDVTLDNPTVRDVLCWGLDDGVSWLQGFLPRPDGRPQRGCPYDALLRPKPMRAAIAAAIRAAPARA